MSKNCRWCGATKGVEHQSKCSSISGTHLWHEDGATNTAAEEGARPTDNEEISIGSPDFFKLLISLEHEPCLDKRMDVAEFVDRHIDKLLSDRASRQVANKAEVDLSSLPLHYKEGVENGGYYLATDVIRLLAAPPGASIPEEELFKLLGGTHYMDEPDGGSPTLLEQLKRMAEDAANYRGLCK